jgi:preprotein translocase subunit SecE
MPATVDEKQGRRRRRQPEDEPKPQAALEADEAEDDYEDEEASGEQRGLTAKKGRATPGRRSRAGTDAAPEEQKGVRGIVGRVQLYWEETRDELNKVVWPTRQDLRRLLTIVLITMLVASLALGVIAILFTELVRIGLSTPLVFGIVMVLVFVGLGFYLYRSNRRTPSAY